MSTYMYISSRRIIRQDICCRWILKIHSLATKSDGIRSDNELSDQHGDVYTTEQIRAWAHMLQMKKHDSYEEPPKKPFFKIVLEGANSNAVCLLVKESSIAHSASTSWTSGMILRLWDSVPPTHGQSSHE